MTANRQESRLLSAFVDKKTNETLGNYWIEKGWLS
jgi:hypothetical protein